MPTTIANLQEKLRYLGSETEVATLAEELFFSDREKGILRSNVLPLPDGVSAWDRGSFDGEPVHFAVANDVLYIVADTDIFGYCLLRYVSEDNGLSYTIAYNRGTRPISKNKGDIIRMQNNMNQSAMSALQQYAGANPMLNPMNLGGAAVGATPVVGGGEGITGGADMQRIRSEARMRGYVAGYVMATAPAISMACDRKKKKEETTVSIIAKESKPSRCLAVLMALPARCVTRSGNLASPTDVQSGNVDFSINKDEMIYQSFSVNAAIAYIAALGGYLPEYAPYVVPGMHEQWSPEEILSGKDGITYVRVNATENRSTKAGHSERFRFTLKSTSPRRSLYTNDNIVCLRAVEHTSVDVKTAKDAYEVNKNAFGAWEFRKRKDDKENALQKAMRECPTQLWETTYEIDGEKVPGIASSFFFAGPSVKAPNGEEIAARPLTYRPWARTGDDRDAAGLKVKKIVKRTYHAAEGDKKAGMKVTPVLYREDPNHEMFRPYARFADDIVRKGFISEDKLKSLGTRTGKPKLSSMELTHDQKTNLELFLRGADVVAEINAVRNEASDRAALREQ